MPTDPTPEGQGIRNKPLDKPFPEPTPDADRGGDAGREGARRSLVTPDLEEPAETTRPPLGN